MSQYSHLTVDLTNENSAPTKVVQLVGRDRQHCEQVLVRDVEEPGWVEELGGERFDVVVFSDVLEHLRDPGRVLRETVPLLEPKAGFVVASVPNVANVSGRLASLLGSL